MSQAQLTAALDQSEQVKDMVEQCATELSSVNVVLRQEIVSHSQLADVARAIDRNGEIEAKVQECADQLATVNNVLSEEIGERRSLDQALHASNAALASSRELEAKALHLALHDAVTNLPNLPLFVDRLDQAVVQAKRGGRRLAVMFIDLDKFKGINDAYGHDVGDDVLKMVARRLRRIVRSGDTISRRSGDEFLFLMLDPPDEKSTATLAIKIIENISREFDIEGSAVTVNPSIGIAIYPDHGLSSQELLKNADFAMYRAKQHARGYSVYRPPAQE